MYWKVYVRLSLNELLESPVDGRADLCTFVEVYRSDSTLSDAFIRELEFLRSDCQLLLVPSHRDWESEELSLPYKHPYMAR